jgi:quinoprotein glucose dehydrogenase
MIAYKSMSRELNESVHVYDSANGRRIADFRLGASTKGSPSMYELNGHQYLLVTASGGAARGARAGAAGPAGVPASGPAGIIAYALPRGD